MYTKNNRSGEERARQMRETELISTLFPGVSRIVVRLHYGDQIGPPMERTLNFHPGSHAFFKLSCLGEGCVGGGLDMTPLLTKMIKNHDESAKGSLKCTNGNSEALHADMSYQVSITYT